jgi:outer membrane protein OmpA-like peptidoglycan-associated protein
LIRDNLDETFTWSNGAASTNQRSVRFRGFTLTFGEGTVPLNTDEVIAAIQGRIPEPINEPVHKPMEEPINRGEEEQKTGWEKDTNIELATVPGGVRLTVKDIRFVPDSDEFLAAEYPRLDKIAEALKQIPDRTFLVEGHTAAVGIPQGEMELSILRAKRMVDELVSRGISADRFMYKGWGGERPLGDNSTDAGRALNRRVEITILE